MEDTSTTLPDTPCNRKEIISYQGNLICMIVRAGPFPDATTFYTPSELPLQVGNIVYPAGSEIPRHTHAPVRHNITVTAEVLVVQRGRMILDLYADDRTLIGSREIAVGDVVVLVAGGHGFRLLEDSVLLEVKQGPYAGVQDKERF